MRSSSRALLEDPTHSRRGPSQHSGPLRILTPAASNLDLTIVAQRIYIRLRMTPRRRYSFWIEDEQSDGLKAVKERDGVLESEQIRRAINDWLEKKGVRKIARKRPVTRRRP